MNFRRFIACALVLSLLLPGQTSSSPSTSYFPRATAIDASATHKAFETEALATSPIASWNPFMPMARVTAITMLAVFSFSQSPLATAQTRQDQRQTERPGTPADTVHSQDLLRNFFSGQDWTEFFDHPSAQAALSLKEDADQLDMALHLNGELAAVFGFITDNFDRFEDEALRRELSKKWYPFRDRVLRPLNFYCELQLRESPGQSRRLVSFVYELASNSDTYEMESIGTGDIFYGRRVDKTTLLMNDTRAVAIPNERFFIFDAFGMGENIELVINRGIEFAKAMGAKKLARDLETLKEKTTPKQRLEFMTRYEFIHEITHNIQGKMEFVYGLNDHFGIPYSQWSEIDADIKTHIDYETLAIEEQIALAAKEPRQEYVAIPLLNLVLRIQQLAGSNNPDHVAAYYSARNIINRLADPNRKPEHWLDARKPEEARKLLETIFDKKDSLLEETSELIKKGYPTMPTLVLKIHSKDNNTARNDGYQQLASQFSDMVEEALPLPLPRSSNAVLAILKKLYESPEVNLSPNPRLINTLTTTLQVSVSNALQSRIVAAKAIDLDHPSEIFGHNVDQDIAYYTVLLLGRWRPAEAVAPLQELSARLSGVGSLFTNNVVLLIETILRRISVPPYDSQKAANIIQTLQNGSPENRRAILFSLAENIRASRVVKAEMEGLQPLFLTMVTTPGVLDNLKSSLKYGNRDEASNAAIILAALARATPDHFTSKDYYHLISNIVLREFAKELGDRKIFDRFDTALEILAKAATGNSYLRDAYTSVFSDITEGKVLIPLESSRRSAIAQFVHHRDQPDSFFASTLDLYLARHLTDPNPFFDGMLKIASSNKSTFLSAEAVKALKEAKKNLHSEKALATHFKDSRLTGLEAILDHAGRASGQRSSHVRKGSKSLNIAA